jgi:hypothetical protein
MTAVTTSPAPASEVRRRANEYQAAAANAGRTCVAARSSVRLPGPELLAAPRSPPRPEQAISSPPDDWEGEPAGE